MWSHVILLVSVTQILFLLCSGDDCFRECTEGEAPRVCFYDFTVEEYFTMTDECEGCLIAGADILGNVTECLKPGCVPGGGQERVVTAVNRQVPGPSIHVCLGDRVVVNVTNHFSSDGAVIHWHGVHQKGTPHMDGAPYLTQCPIPPHTYFVYNFTADVPGTHVWHAHIGFEEADGVFGSMIIRRPSDPQSSEYDFDLPEHTMVVWHWFANTARDMLTKIKFKPNPAIPGEGLLINGLGGMESLGQGHIKDTFNNITRAVFSVEEGKRYRFRVIFNTALPCPIQMSVEGHRLLAINSESSSFSPEPVDAIMLNGGERYDFVLTANSTPGNYWIRFRGLASCITGSSGVHQEAVLHYSNADYDLPDSMPTYENAVVNTSKILNPIGEIFYDYQSNELVYVSSLKNIEKLDDDIGGDPAKVIYVEFSSATYKESGIPAHWPQVNRRTFSYPSFPLLTQRSEINRDTYCTDENNVTEGTFHACPYLYKINLNSLVEFVFLDTATRGSDHPMHIHGNHFHVVATEIVLDQNITKDYIMNLNQAGNITKNFDGPVKDTISVPSGGFAVLRFNATNPGFWFFHCHISNHAELGMGFVVQVGEINEMPETPSDFAECRNWKYSNIKTTSDGGKLLSISVFALLLTFCPRFM